MNDELKVIREVLGRIYPENAIVIGPALSALDRLEAQPAPAEQGEGLLKQASNKLANAISDQDWGEAASASNDLDEYLAPGPKRRRWCRWR